MPPTIILVSGHRYSGKDTVSDFLTEILRTRGLHIRRTAFAAELKREYARQHPGVDVHRLFTDSAYKEQHRRGLIEFGAVERAKNVHVWVDKVLDSITLADDVVIISDCRFTDEVARVKFRYSNNVLLRVWANDEARMQRGWQFDPTIDNDRSETDLAQQCSFCTWYIPNSGTLPELKTLTDSLARDIFTLFFCK